MSGGAKTSADGVFDADGALARLAHEMADPPFPAMSFAQSRVGVDEDGTAKVRLPFRSEFRRGRESPFYHGGVIASLVDIAAHAAIAVRVGRTVPTIERRIDYLHAAPAGDLLATGKILVVGRSVGRADVEVRSAEGKVVAVGRGAFSTRES